MLRVLTTTWGVVLVLDAGVRVVLAYTLPVDQVPLVSGLQYLGVYAALEITTRLYGRRPAGSTGSAPSPARTSLPEGVRRAWRH